MPVGGDFWGSRPIEVKHIRAITLSARVNSVVGTAVTHIVRPASKPRFIAFQVLAANGFWIKPGYHPGLTFVDGNVNISNERIAITAHGFTSGDGPYQLTTTGVLPTGLELLTDYFVRAVDDNTITLHTSHTSATKGLTPVDITSNSGGGTHTIAEMASANPTSTNTDGQEAPFIDSTSGKGGELAAVLAMPEQLTVRGDNAASNLVYWFLP